MAEEESTKRKLPRRRKTPETVRERAEKQTQKANKQPKLRGKIHRPLSVLRRAGAKEFHPVKLPESKKTGRILNKRIHFTPKFVREAWAEIRMAKWSTPKEAARLTLAVFIFSAVFAVFVQLLDFVFSKLFKEILLG